MQKLRDRPIREKITFVIMLISGVVLLLAFAALFCFQAYTLKRHSAHELAVVGEITAHNCAPAVMFQDEGAAGQILAGLKTMPQIVSARLELRDQQRLAFFGAVRDELEIKATRLNSGFRIDGNRILLAQPVMLDGKREGTLYLLADLQAMTSQLLKLYGGIFALVLAASLFLAFLLSRQFLRFITNPILRLAGTARTIADHKDYSVRADKVCGDEVGILTDAFNQMLAQIQSQDNALQDAQRELRDQVNALQREIGERQRAEAAHDRLTAILEATPDIVISADPNGSAFYLNHAGRQILGLARGQRHHRAENSRFSPRLGSRDHRRRGIPGGCAERIVGWRDSHPHESRSGGLCFAGAYRAQEFGGRTGILFVCDARCDGAAAGRGSIALFAAKVA